MDITTIDEAEMVSTMKAQHAELRTEMEAMAEHVTNPSLNAEILLADMNALKKTLEEHLALETTVFYPQLLERMEKKHFDISATRVFIAQMQVISDQAFSFFIEFNSVESIRTYPEKYQATLKSISSALMTRMSTEEDSVYLYW